MIWVEWVSVLVMVIVVLLHDSVAENRLLRIRACNENEVSLLSDLFNRTIRFLPGQLLCRETDTVILNISARFEAPDSKIVTRLLPPTLLESGYLRAHDGNYLPPSKYCISTNSPSEKSVSVQYCQLSLQEVDSLMPKCCPPGKLLARSSSGKMGCENPSGDLLQVRPFWNWWNESTEVVTSSTEDASYRGLTIPLFCGNGTKCCPWMHKLDVPSPKNKDRSCFRITREGTLTFLKERQWQHPVPNTEFCFDGLRESEDGRPFAGKSDDFMVITSCQESIHTDTERNRTYQIVYGVLMAIAALFPLAALVIYIMLWKHQNIHGKMRMFFCTCAFCFYALMAFIRFAQNYSPWMENEQPVLCQVVGILAHFFWLAIFSWLSVISFNVFWMLRKIFDSNLNSTRRMLFSMAFGWGLPVIYISVSVALEYTVGRISCTTIMTPQYGQAKNCYLAPDASGPYLYYPVAVLLTINMVLYVTSIYFLERAKSGINDILQASVHNHKKTWKTYFKIFLTVGVTWILDFISWLYEARDFSIVGIVLDSVVVLQSIIVFIMLIANPKLARQFSQQYPVMHRNLRKVSDLLAPKRSNSKLGTPQSHTPITSVTSLPMIVRPNPAPIMEEE